MAEEHDLHLATEEDDARSVVLKGSDRLSGELIVSGITRQTQRTGDAEPHLLDLIKTKFNGYFRWTAFAMLLAPIAFWIVSRS